MKIERREGKRERRILTGMIVDKVVLGRIAPKWQGQMFKSPWSNIIGQWCVDFYNKYSQEAPGSAIQGLFETWAEDARDDESIRLIDRFLASLSGEYEQLSKESNSDLTVDLAATHFNEVAILHHLEQVQGDVDGGKVDKALERIISFRQVEMSSAYGIDVLRDEGAIQSAFTKSLEPLIVYPHALENFFGNSLTRDAFIAFEGPEKRGKSHWLLDLAWRAMMQRRRVAYFQVGDMSQDQIMRRFLIRAARHPLTACTVKIPTFIEMPQSMGEDARVDHKDKVFDKGLTAQRGWRACRKVIKRTHSKRTLLRLSCHPNTSVNVRGIEGILKVWERDDWIPDVVVIDYADILAPPQGVIESRDQINATWNQLRALSQSHHCLVVTASQTDANSYQAITIDKSNFSGDKRKHAHVTGMVGINQSDPEKEVGIMRLNWVVRREAAFSEKRCCFCAGSLDIGDPAILSTF